MDVLEFICNAAQRLLSRLECNFVIDSQLKDLFEKNDNLKNQELDILIMQHKATILFYNKVTEYLKIMNEKSKGFSPFKQAVSIHLYAIEQIDPDFFIEVIQEHHKALSSTLGIPIPEDSQSPEEALTSVSYFFPFNIVIPLMRRQDFFTELLKISIEFHPNEFKSSVLKIFKLFKNCNLPIYSKIAVSEILLDYFVADIKKSTKVSELDNFQFLQNCKLLIKSGYLSLTTEEFVTKLKPTETELIHQNESNSSQYQQGFSDFKLDPKTNLCFDDDGIVLEIPTIEHVWIQLRRMPVAISTTAVLVVLEKALEWLRSVLKERNVGIGADEVFQFFVVCLVNSKILELPTLISILETYTVEDLIASKNTYMMQQLKSAFEFIQTRQVRVPPFLIFPFDSTDNPDLKREGNGHVLLPRFAVYAYPTYLKTPFKAFLYYTGNQTDCAIGYPFTAVEGHICQSLIDIGNKFTPLPTTNGSLFHIDSNEIAQNSMILVNDGDYVSRFYDVEVLSNLMVMVQKKVRHPSIEMIDPLMKELMESWRLTQIPTKETVIKLIQNLQENLVTLGHQVNTDGIISDQTVSVIKKLVHFNNEFFINLKIYNYIIQLIKQQNQQ